MTSTVVGRAARMTGLKKPRPLRRVMGDDTDVSEPNNNTELEKKMRNFNLIQSKAEAFIKSSPPRTDEPENPLPPSEPNNFNINQKTNKPSEIFQQHNIMSDTNNNICPRPDQIKTLHPPPGFPIQQREVKVTNKNQTNDTSPKGRKGTSYTAIINLKGDNKDERLVLASTCMKSILKAANLLACHMNGELVYIDSSDGESPERKTGNTEITDMQTSPQLPTSPTGHLNPPSRRALQAHMPDLPDLVKPDYGRSLSDGFVVESQQDWRCLSRSKRRSCSLPRPRSYSRDQSKPASSWLPSVQYMVKDLLIMSRQPHAKLPPRNWSLIKEAFPELVSCEDRYFEPFDLKACSPHALGRPRMDFESRCHMDSLEFQ